VSPTLHCLQQDPLLGPFLCHHLKTPHVPNDKCHPVPLPHSICQWPLFVHLPQFSPFNMLYFWQNPLLGFVFNLLTLAGNPK
jgi:hypothetical protein